MGMKLVSVVLLVALALGGPLGSVAWAQQKAEAQMAAPKTDQAWEVGAAVVNAVHVPGKAVLCLTGGVSGVAILLLSFGSGYEWAGRAWQEGCGGRWTVTAADVKPRPESVDFWMERPEYQR